MEKNIILKFIAESQMDGTISDMEQFKQKIDETVKKLTDMQSAHKQGSKEWKAYGDVISGVEKEFKDIQSEVSKSGKSLEEYTKKFSDIIGQMADGAVKAPRFTTQLRQMKDELAKMEDAGEFGTKAFTKLAIKAGQLEDQIGDTRQRIKTLSSDTKNLDAAMGVGQGLAGTFMVATSTAALFGGENEELQKAFFKVQAALSILNGVQQVANVLNKDSVANVVLGTAMENSNTVSKVRNTVSKYANVVATKLETAAENGSKVAKVGSTAAQWALNSAMLANPAAWVIGGILALVGAYMIFKSTADDTKKVQESLNFTLKNTSKEIDEIDSSADFDIRIAEASGKSAAEIRKIRFEAIKTKIALAEMASDDVFRAGNKATKEQREESQKMLQDAYKAEKKYFDDAVVEQIKDRNAANKKARDASKEANKKNLEDSKQAKKELEDTLNALMNDGLMKEIDAIETSYARKKAEITGNSKDEIDLRKQLENLKNKEIAAVKLKYSQDDVRIAKELEILKLENASADSVKDIALKKSILEKKAELDIISINQSKDNEDTKAEKIKAVRLQLKADLADIDKNTAQQEIDAARLATDKRISQERYNAEMILASAKSSWKDKQNAREDLTRLDSEELDAEGVSLKDSLAKKLITQEQYEQSMFDLKERYRKLDIDKEKEKADYQKELQQAIFNFGVELVGAAFDYKKQQLQKEMEDLDHYYTTDPEEAKKSGEKKLITEQALAAKKLEIKRKQAQIEKNEALFQIAVNTAQAAMASLAKTPLPLGLPFMLMNLAMGAIQADVVSARPLPKYAKGRKGGRGEMAMVGELGPEIMWVPDSASIIPHGKRLTPDVLEAFGIPKLSQIDKNVPLRNMGTEIDYEKLGRAVADNIRYPENKPVTVNVDGTGVTVSDGNMLTTYMNKKYRGTW